MATDSRVPMTFRVAQKKREWIEATAHEEWTDLSTVVRAALVVAQRHEPELKKVIGQIKDAG